MESRINQTLDHLFRHQYGQIISGLTSRYGPHQIEFIEDAVQDSLLKASQVWAFNGIPENPSAWLFIAARNKFLDLLKRHSKSETLKFDIGYSEGESLLVMDSEIADEQLKMIFACCNSAIQNRDSLLLSLKLIGGFSISEIARALMIRDETAKKSFQRAKAKFKKEVGKLYVPSGHELKDYLPRVLKVIYLMFNEGYKTSNGKELLNQDLCGEALRLVLLLIDKDECKTLASCSLVSLMSYKIARFDARVEKGRLITLKNQNRKLWIREFVEWGNYYFSQATLFKQIDKFYLEASIEFEYHIAEDYQKTNWNRIAHIHQLILSHYKSPAAELNYLIILAKVKGSEEVYQRLLDVAKSQLHNHLYFAFKSELEIDLGLKESAKESLLLAIQLSNNRVEKNYLQEKLGLIP